MPIKICLLESSIQGFLPQTKNNSFRKSNAKIPTYPSISIIVTKEFDEQNDADDFDELLILDITIFINEILLYTKRNINKDKYKDKISIEKIITDYKEKTGNDLPKHFNFDIIVKDSFGSEVSEALNV